MGKWGPSILGESQEVDRRNQSTSVPSSAKARSPEIKEYVLAQISEKEAKTRRSQRLAREEFYKKQVEDISQFLGIPAIRPRGYTWEKYYDELFEKNMEKLTRYYQK
jgi:hypothetical protein